MKIYVALIFVLGCSSAFPTAAKYPRAYMLGGSFYANPRHVRQGSEYEYNPPSHMTTMVLGDTVATNTFAGPGYNPPQSLPVQEPDSNNETEPQEHVGEQETLFSLEEGTTEHVTPAITSRAPNAGRKIKTGKAKRPTTTAAPQVAEEEDEEDAPASWPFGGKAGIPNYNAFFPIFIGGNSGRSRTRSTDNQEGGYPGSATAIANSFSTGKGGVATSHATSFGDPYAAAMFRNAGLFRTKSTKKHAVLEEEY